MEINLKKDSIKTSKIIYESNVSNQIENEITLPDYCPDILKILKCCLIPCIKSTHISGNRVTADGNAIIRIIYSDENNAVRSYETSAQFSKYIENDDISPEAFAIVKSNTEYINCHVISPRKISVNGSINISFKVLENNYIEFLSDTEDSNVQLRKDEKIIVIPNDQIEKSFPLNEIIELPEDKDSVKSILNISANATINDLKNIKNKFLLKGNLNIIITYCTKSNDNEIETLSHSLPINQIIESKDADEDCTYNSYLDIQSLEILTKSDSSGEERILEINAKVSAVISSYKEQSFSVIKDAYSITDELEKEEKSIEIRKLVNDISDNLFVHNNFDLQDLGIQKILYTWYGNVSINSSIDDNKYKISGSVDIYILGFDGNEQIVYTDRKIDYEYISNIDTSANKITSNPVVQVIAFEYNQQGKNLDVKLELFVNADIIAIEFERVIDSISVNKTENNVKDIPSLTIYFSDEGESIWNIAKKYNTTVEAIMSENELSNEVLTEKRMLLIPAI